MTTLLILMTAHFVTVWGSPWLHRLLGYKSGWIYALFPTAMMLQCLVLFEQVRVQGAFTIYHEWFPSIGLNLSFHVDGLALLMSTLITGIGSLILIYGSSYLKNHIYLPRFLILIQLFLISMLGLVLADNMMLMFIFWELTSLTSYLLIGFVHDKQESRTAALHALLITAGGGLALLVGVLMLGLEAGSFEISALKASGFSLGASGYETALLVFILLGAFTKSAQFPFHFWLPNAMAAPTPVSAYLHSATMVKAGVYLLARFQPLFFEHFLWTETLMLFGALTMLWAAFLAIKKTDLKQILAYTTLSALGLMTMLIAWPSAYAATAFASFLLAHALYKGSLFMIAGIIDHQTKTREVSRLQGLATSLPWTAAGTALAALAMAGLFPTLSFIAKEIILESLVSTPIWGFVLTMAVALAAATFTFVALQFIYIFFANRSNSPSYKEAYSSLYAGPLLLAILGVLFGIFSPWLQDYINLASHSLVEASGPSLILWHGINLPLLISLASLALGVLLFFIFGKKPIEWGNPTLDRIASASLFNKLFDISLLGAEKFAHLIQHGYLRNYLRVVIASTVILLFLSFAKFSIPELTTDLSDFMWHEIGVCLIIALAAIAATNVQSRLATIACLGVIGFMVATIYVMYSAPDLALTQILVETLTVILFALVIYRLPVYQRLSSNRALVLDALLSIGMGMAFTILVLSAATIQWYEPISIYHGEQSWLMAYGRNVVNVILVDFRALDTMGEIAVIGISAVGVYSLLKFKRRRRSLL